MPRKITKSKYKKEDIINSIISMRVEKMATTKTILDFLINELGYGQTYAYELISESRDKIVEIYNQKNGPKVEEAVAQLEAMLEGASTRKDYKLAFNIRQDISKLKGLYVDRVELSGDLTHHIPDVIKLIEVKRDE